MSAWNLITNIERKHILTMDIKRKRRGQLIAKNHLLLIPPAELISVQIFWYSNSYE